MKQKRFISCVGVRLLTLIAAVLLMGQTAKAENYGQSSNPSPIPLHRVRAPSLASRFFWRDCIAPPPSPLLSLPARAPLHRGCVGRQKRWFRVLSSLVLSLLPSLPFDVPWVVKGKTRLFPASRLDVRFDAPWVVKGKMGILQKKNVGVLLHNYTEFLVCGWLLAVWQS